MHTLWDLGFAFDIQVEASSAEIKELYSQGGPESDESTNIFFVSVIIQFLVTFEVILLAKVSDVSKNQLDDNLKNRSKQISYK